MTDNVKERLEAICRAGCIDNIGDLSDGYHTFNQLYHQRAILFAALVRAYKDRAWKSKRHEDGELCFGGGWLVVGIDTPEGSYTYHYELKYWDMFDCKDLPRAPHWDGHTEDDAETRLLSLDPEEHDGDVRIISRDKAVALAIDGDKRVYLINPDSERVMKLRECELGWIQSKYIYLHDRRPQ